MYLKLQVCMKTQDNYYKENFLWLIHDITLTVQILRLEMLIKLVLLL